MADEELTEDAEGRLFDKDGVEHVPDDDRRSPWFRLILWVGFAFCLFSTGALIASGVRGNWGFFWGALSENIFAWVALICLCKGLIWKD